MTNPPCSISRHFFHHPSTLWQDSKGNWLTFEELVKAQQNVAYLMVNVGLLQRHISLVVFFNPRKMNELEVLNRVLHFFNVKMPSSKQNLHIYYLFIAVISHVIMLARGHV